MPKIPVKNLSVEGTLSIATGGSIQIGSAALSETQLQTVVNEDKVKNDNKIKDNNENSGIS